MYNTSEVVGHIIIVFFLLQGCQRVAEDWQRIIQVRSLVVSPSEDMNTWLKYASLCRKNGRLVRKLKSICQYFQRKLSFTDGILMQKWSKK